VLPSAEVLAVQSEAFSLAEDGFAASAVVPSLSRARFCSAGDVVATQPELVARVDDAPV
jgi:hypothetical protein